MNFLEFKDAYDMMQQTGMSAPECLRIVNIEIENIRRKIGENEYEANQKSKIES